MGTRRQHHPPQCGRREWHHCHLEELHDLCLTYDDGFRAPAERFPSQLTEALFRPLRQTSALAVWEDEEMGDVDGPRERRKGQIVAWDDSMTA